MKSKKIDDIIPDDEEEIFEPEQDTVEQLMFVNMIGVYSDLYYVYELLFTGKIDEAWGEDWDVKPAGICGNILPNDDSYDLRKVFMTRIKLDLAKNNSCFSMQDCTDNIIPLAWENLDEVDEYPDNGRIILSFGATYQDVDDMLAKRGIFLNDSLSQ